MALGKNIRKFIFQNASTGNQWDVTLIEASDGSISGVGRRMEGDDPLYDNSETALVVVTAKLDKVFGTSAQHNSALCYAAYFDASNAAAGGAALSTLLS